MCPVPKESEDFVVADGNCDCWGNADYKPPEDLKYLMSERERERLQDHGSEQEEFEVSMQRRRVSSFQQRLAEKKTRGKRLAMTKEAHRWYMECEASKLKEPHSSSTTRQMALPTKKKRMARPTKNPQSIPKSTNESRGNTDLNKVLRRSSPYYIDLGRMEIGLRAAGFTTPKRKDKDSIALRSPGSEMKRQRNLDAI